MERTRSSAQYGRCRAGMVLLPLFLWPAPAAQAAGDQSLDVNGLRIRYQVSGQGPPVVLLHGFGETLEVWSQHGIVRPLTPEFRVMTMDVRGHGRSAKPHATASYGRELAEDVVRLLDHVGAAKAHV